MTPTGSGDSARSLIVESDRRAPAADAVGDHARRTTAAAASSTRTPVPASLHSSSTGVGPTPHSNTNSRRPRAITPSAASANVRADRRMPGHRQLASWREDPHPHVPAGLVRKNEGRLREVHLVGDALHPLGRELRVRLRADRELIAFEGRIGEDVEVEIAHTFSSPGSVSSMLSSIHVEVLVGEAIEEKRRVVRR